MRNKVSFSLFYLFYLGAFGAFYPLLTVYFNNLGYQTSMVSKVMSAALLLQLIFQPTFGILSDKYKKVKQMINTFLLITGLAGLFMGFIHSMPIVLGLFAILSVFNVSIIALTDTLILQTIENKEDYGSIRAWGAIGYAVFSFLSSIIVSKSDSSLVPVLYGILIILTFLVSLTFPNAPVTHDDQEESAHAGLKEVFKNKMFLIFAVGGIFIFGIHQANVTFFPNFIEGIHGNLVEVGTSFLIVCLFEGLSMFLSSYLINKFGMRKVMLVASSLVTLRWFMYSLAPAYNFVFPALVINGLAIGLFGALVPQIIAKLTKGTEYEGTFQTMYWTIANTIGTMIVTYTGGVVLDITDSIFKVYLVFGFLGILGVLLINYSLSKKKAK